MVSEDKTGRDAAPVKRELDNVEEADLPDMVAKRQREEASQYPRTVPEEQMGNSRASYREDKMESPSDSAEAQTEAECGGASTGSAYSGDRSAEETIGRPATPGETSGASSPHDGWKREEVKHSRRKGPQGEMDLFGQFLPYVSGELVKCKRCGRSIMAGKFAMHLSRCMGYGRNSRNS
ncbi:hypothetical protein BSKO_00438 [Bryopsis sp. KO-2023]|nr:hypothetical protein BSKO_00438 [Bryopsis sp. KO-2023]